MHRTIEELRLEIENTEEMLVWVTRDDNRIHLLARLGDLKARLAWQVKTGKTLL